MEGSTPEVPRLLTVHERGLCRTGQNTVLFSAFAVPRTNHLVAKRPVRTDLIKGQRSPPGICGNLYVLIPRSHHPVPVLTVSQNFHRPYLLSEANGTSTISSLRDRSDE